MKSSLLASLRISALLGIATTCAQSAILFTGSFAPGAWTTTLPDPTALTTFNASTLALKSPDNAPPFALQTSRVEIAVPQSGTITFSYSGSTADADWTTDSVGYRVGAITTQLSPNVGSAGFSGTASVPVTSGGLFSFYSDGSDSCCGAATITVTNFDFVPVPEPSTYALMFGFGLLGFGYFRRSQARLQC